MNCKAIERLILEAEERPLGETRRRAVEDHLRTCPGCRAFRAGRRALRENLSSLAEPRLPPALDERTRRLCLETLVSGRGADSPAPAGRRVPVPVIAVAVLFTVLAAVWLAGTLADVTPGEPFPAAVWVAVAFIAQNVLMLFLSPVVFRGARPAEKETLSFG
jgi:anti-sigma factor RsiW